MMADKVATELAGLTASVIRGFEAVAQRFEDFKQTSNERHEENVERLIRIEEEVKMTNGRVTRHDEQIRSILRGDRQADTYDKRTFTKRDVQMLLAGGGALVAAWKFLEWGIHVLKP